MQKNAMNQTVGDQIAPGEQSGVLIRADNGDVITFDETGLTLRLSETVLSDIRQRLSQPLEATELLGDIDAWNLRQQGDWFRFSAQLDAGLSPRDYQRPVAGGDIIAAAPGPLYAVLSIGGARRAGFNDAPPEFPYHVLAPADHIGAVGLEGTGNAIACDGVQQIPYATRDTLIASTLLDWRRAARRGLPLFLARTETDNSASIAELARGRAYSNLLIAFDNLVSAADSLGKRAKVVAIGLDFSLEDCRSDAVAYAEGMRTLMRQIERDMGLRGLQRPFFLAIFESGTERVAQHASIYGQWDLAWSHGSHKFSFSAPSYMFDYAEFGRPTENARLRMSEMDAYAITSLSADISWTCPLFLLAEQEGDSLRVTARAMDDLVVDASDPFKVGATMGFTISDTTKPVTVLSVAVSNDDEKSLILRCDRPIEGTAPMLHYAFQTLGGRANAGAIRDTWSMPSRGGGPALHRWALPAILPIHKGAA